MRMKPVGIYVSLFKLCFLPTGRTGVLYLHNNFICNCCQPVKLILESCFIVDCNEKVMHSMLIRVKYKHDHITKHVLFGYDCIVAYNVLYMLVLHMTKVNFSKRFI